MSLYKYQIEGIDKLYNIVTTRDERCAMLCDPPGAGKTPQAIGVIEKLKAKKVLIVCPASLRDNWAREVAKWHKEPLTTQVIFSSKDKIGDVNVLILSYPLATRCHEALKNYNFDVLICDESHYMKNAKTQYARIILVLLWAQCKYRLLLTGTPLPNGRAIEAFTTFSRCDYENFGSWSRFRTKYCVPEVTKWGTNYTHSKNLDELKRLSQSFMVRRTRAEVLAELPGIVRQNIYLNLPELEIFEAQGDLDIDEIVASVENGLPLESEHITTVRRKLAELKSSHVLEHVLETLEEVEQVVVFVHHRSLYDYLFAKLLERDIATVGINGLTPAVDRQQYVDTFQRKEASVFIASLKAASTGFTLTSASTLIMAEYDWVPSTNEQAEGRVYRVTQQEISRVRYLVAANSLDEKVLRVIQRKQNAITKALGEA
jgi:SWI/SNF-related matrix-associated actin-dependent regulator 1 of chromatin subfamily A